VYRRAHWDGRGAVLDGDGGGGGVGGTWVVRAWGDVAVGGAVGCGGERERELRSQRGKGVRAGGVGYWQGECDGTDMETIRSHPRTISPHVLTPTPPHSHPHPLPLHTFNDGCTISSPVLSTAQSVSAVVKDVTPVQLYTWGRRGRERASGRGRGSGSAEGGSKCCWRKSEGWWWKGVACR
jgi:hypothetical protein